MQSAASLQHDGRDARVHQRPKRRRQVVVRQGENPGAGGGEVARRRGRTPRRARYSTIMTGPASSVESTRADGGVRSRRSKITRVSGRSPVRAAGRQQRIVGEDRARIRHAIASTSARWRWMRRSAAGPVSRVRTPGCPRRPSRLTAAFKRDMRTAQADVGQEYGVLPRGGGLLHAHDCLDAAAPAGAAGRRRSRAGWVGIATTARRIPARLTSGAQGPVLPVWEQGSSVQYKVAPRARSPASSRAIDFGVGAAGDSMRAPSDDHSIGAHHQRADHRIRAGPPTAALRKRQGFAH